ncbi:MAG TPA: flagellar protein FlaG [Limnochordales bacterium]
MSTSLSGHTPSPGVRPVVAPVVSGQPGQPALSPAGGTPAAPAAAAPADDVLQRLTATGEEQGSPVPRPVVRRTTDLLNAILAESRRQLKFHVHEATGRIWVQVIDSRTQEVIKEIPPERYLDLVARIWELVGILVDERA